MKHHKLSDSIPRTFDWKQTWQLAETSWDLNESHAVHYDVDRACVCISARKVLQ